MVSLPCLLAITILEVLQKLLTKPTVKCSDTEELDFKRNLSHQVKITEHILRIKLIVVC